VIQASDCAAKRAERMMRARRRGTIGHAANTGTHTVLGAYARFGCHDIARILYVVPGGLVACLFELTQLRLHFGAGHRLIRLGERRHGGQLIFHPHPPICTGAAAAAVRADHGSGGARQILQTAQGSVSPESFASGAFHPFRAYINPDFN
jgi:hypothetical protein